MPNEGMPVNNMPGRAVLFTCFSVANSHAHERAVLLYFNSARAIVLAGLDQLDIGLSTPRSPRGCRQLMSKLVQAEAATEALIHRGPCSLQSVLSAAQDT